MRHHKCNRFGPDSPNHPVDPCGLDGRDGPLSLVAQMSLMALMALVALVSDGCGEGSLVGPKCQGLLGLVLIQNYIFVRFLFSPNFQFVKAVVNMRCESSTPKSPLCSICGPIMASYARVGDPHPSWVPGSKTEPPARIAGHLIIN